MTLASAGGGAPRLRHLRLEADSKLRTIQAPQLERRAERLPDEAREPLGGTPHLLLLHESL